MHAQQGKPPIPAEGGFTPEPQQWQVFQPRVEKSLAGCRPERAGGKVRVCEQFWRLLAPYGEAL